MITSKFPYFFEIMAAKNSAPSISKLDDKIMGSKNVLKLRIFSRVRITNNLNTTRGLTNGAIGRVENFI